MQDWTWSYSRLRMFEQCPYAFFRKYIDGMRGGGNFYSDYGGLVHDIHDLYYSGLLEKDEVERAFLNLCDTELTHKIDAQTRGRFIAQGMRYFREGIYSPPGVVFSEKRIDSELGGVKFTGIIDLLYKDGGKTVICDHKTHDLRPRSKRGGTKSDKELDEYLTQLFLYAKLAQKELGIDVDAVEFNCFRFGNVIREPVTEEAVDKAVKWALDTVHRAEETEIFNPEPDFWYCNKLCDMRFDCDYR